MTYQLFAARDGDVVHRYLPTDDRETAERLAAAVIAEAFALEADCFDEIVAETDGYHLEPVERERRGGSGQAAPANIAAGA